jgi:hypothetical protein
MLGFHGEERGIFYREHATGNFWIKVEYKVIPVNVLKIQIALL